MMADTLIMAGRTERESRVTQTGGTTDTQRDALILELARRGWSLSRIGNHPSIRMTKPGIHYALRRLRGQVRVQVRTEICDYCVGTFPASELNINGLCQSCAGGAEKPPPPEEW
jgi:hypothetical protein